jgi:hypothetical protein
MATSIAGISVPVLTPVITANSVRACRRRRISPEAGHALQFLGHAIEYLTDEYVYEGGLFSAHDPRIEAIQLLMARNREIYLECPEVPTLGQRVRGLLRIH